MVAQEDPFGEVARLVAQFEDAAARMDGALRPVAARLRQVLESPQVQALIEADKAGTLTPMVRERGCYCLCGHHHPGLDICEGVVPEAEMRPVPFVSERLGRVEVLMCASCAGAVLEAAGR